LLKPKMYIKLNSIALSGGKLEIIITQIIKLNIQRYFLFIFQKKCLF